LLAPARFATLAALALPTSPLSAAEHRLLVEIARRVRERILGIVYQSGSGHVGAALSQTDLLVALYRRYLRIDPRAPRDPGRDRFVLSKGHGGLGLAAVLADFRFLDEEALATFGQTGSALGMHMDHRKVPGIEASTGSLGHGLGIALGMALGLRQQRLAARAFCLLSDGECYEGSTWEAALAAPALKAGNLIAVVDRNRLTMDGFTEVEVPLEPLAEKFAAFGWRVSSCDGHDFGAITAALDEAVHAESERPAILIARTIKGKGVDFMEDQPKWHYGALDSDMYARALRSVGAMYERSAIG
jgi:transketolase